METYTLMFPYKLSPKTWSFFINQPTCHNMARCSIGQSLAPTQVGGIPPTWVGGTTQKLTCVLVMCIAHDQLNSPLTPLSTVKPSDFSLSPDSSAGLPLRRSQRLHRQQPTPFSLSPLHRSLFPTDPNTP
jgi:hypothetical protein